MLGESVITLTGHPGRSNEFGASVEAFPFRFDDPAAMAGSMNSPCTNTSRPMSS